MPARLSLAPAAARDLDDIRGWLTQPGAGRAAAEMLFQILDAVDDVALAPFRWAPSRSHPGMRVRYVRGHAIIYEAEPDLPGTPIENVDVLILRVFAPGQNRTDL
ncbi:type II toxin-antitoxin system RelE/ParE family toxin [Salinarimonas sp. NSM]|uniref:type II toxin-antitoxin system RelE/ParE family toxin n=1 Tax=Salinarimonas sp. NSM TaxID=3458003 RepID=UPI0040356EA3